MKKIFLILIVSCILLSVIGGVSAEDSLACNDLTTTDISLICSDTNAGSLNSNNSSFKWTVSSNGHNIYKLTDLSTNKSYSVYKQSVESDRDLGQFFESSYPKHVNFVVLNLKPDIHLNYSSYYSVKNLNEFNSYVVINGNGATVEWKYDHPVEQIFFWENFYAFKNNNGMQINNLTFSNFPNVIVNNGKLIMTDVVFKTNSHAVCNYGNLKVINCTFEDNKESINNKKEGYLTSVNSEFNHNSDFKGKDILSCDDSFTKVITTDSFINAPSHAEEDNALYVSRSSMAPVNYTMVISSAGDFNRAKAILNDYKNYDEVYLTFSEGISTKEICSNEIVFNKPLVEKVFIDGSGLKFNAVHKFGASDVISTILNPFAVIKDPGKTVRSQDNHFLINKPNHMVCLCNATISGFNMAVINQGTFEAINVVFEGNKVEYLIHEDYGGAIDNKKDVICINCIFKNNYGKYAGAIYNHKGALSSIFNCSFEDNHAYKNNSDVDIFNSVGAFSKIASYDNVTVKVVNEKGLTQAEFIFIKTSLDIFVISAGVAFSPLLASALSNVVGAAVAEYMASALTVFGGSFFESAVLSHFTKDFSFKNTLNDAVLAVILSPFDKWTKTNYASYIFHEAIVNKLNSSEGLTGTYELSLSI